MRNRFLLSALVCIPIIAVIGYWLIIRGAFGGDMARSGQFGDTFGALNTLFTGLAFGVVLATLILQGRQIEENRRDVEEERRLNSRLNLYERRFQVYQAVLDFVGYASSSDKIDVNHVIRFDVACNEAFFLFAGDNSLLEYLRLIRTKAEEYNTLKSLADGIPGPRNPQRTEYADRMLKIKEWLFEQPGFMRERFAKHLSFK